jgi:hypothetical protein
MSKRDHEFTALAPERGEDDALMWYWCLRCGALKLGDEIFSPGKHQQPTIVPDEKDPECDEDCARGGPENCNGCMD